MPVSIGSRLRKVRADWGLSLRDVEDRSLRLAQELEDPSYQISAGWLSRVEREEHELTATKLAALASIYGVPYDQILGSITSAGGYFCTSTLSNVPNATVLLDRSSDTVGATSLPVLQQGPESPPEETALLPPFSEFSPSPFRRAILGRLDRSLDPMIRAGAVLEIHTRRRAIIPRRGWNHEFDRPIYLLLSHTGYACGWCELDPDSMWLTLIPHPLSHATSRRWRFRKEIEVIGQVVAVHMRLDSNT